MVSIHSAEHAFAAAATDLVKTGKLIESKVLPVLKTAQASEATVEAVTGLVDPQYVNIERGAFAVLGVLIQAIEDAGTAADSKGLNVTFDASVVADIKAIIPAVKSSAATALSAAIATTAKS